MFNLFKKLKADNDKSIVNYHILNSSVVINYSGKTFTIAHNDERYSKVIECIKTNNLGGIPEIVETERQFLKSGFSFDDGLLYYQDEAIPPELNERILIYKNLGLPYNSLLLFWENLKQNPSFDARQQLFKFLTHNGHPLTEDGCFIAYRGVTNDFKDLHTRKFNNSVGSICEMKRELVDDNPNNTCSTGLHVACYEYAKDFGQQLIVVKVNPRDVVAVPTDYNGTKMRVCRFEVVSIGEKIHTEALYGKPEMSNQQESLPETQERIISFGIPASSVNFQALIANQLEKAKVMVETVSGKESESKNRLCNACHLKTDSFFSFCPHCGNDFNS